MPKIKTAPMKTHEQQWYRPMILDDYNEYPPYQFLEHDGVFRNLKHAGVQPAGNKCFAQLKPIMVFAQTTQKNSRSNVGATNLVRAGQAVTRAMAVMSAAALVHL